MVKYLSINDTFIAFISVIQAISNYVLNRLTPTFSLFFVITRTVKY